MFAVIALAIGAAAFNALGAAGEQRAASRLAALRLHSRTAGPDANSRTTGPSRTNAGFAPRTRRGPNRPSWRHARRSLASGYWFAAILISTPLWLAGWSADALGFFGQAAALHLGSLSIVQPIMVTTLLFSLPLGAIGTGRRPGMRDWVGAATIATGLALILSTRHIPTVQTVKGTALAVAMVAVTTGVVALVGFARHLPAHRAALLSVAAGALFSVGAAATKLTASAYTDGGFAGLVTSWPAYALAAASVAGLALQQAGFASGSLPVAMTALVITDPLVSYGLGVVGFGESVPTTGSTLTLAVLGAMILAGGTAALAHSPLLHPPGIAEQHLRVQAKPPPRATVPTPEPASPELPTPEPAAPEPAADTGRATSALRLWPGPMSLPCRPAPPRQYAEADGDLCTLSHTSGPRITRAAPCGERTGDGGPQASDAPARMRKETRPYGAR